MDISESGIGTVRDLPLTWNVTKGALRWPEEDECDHDAGLGGNRNYEDMRGMTWPDVDLIMDIENVALTRIFASDKPDEEEGLIEEEFLEDPEWPMFDIGVASLVSALSACGCVPFTSCNGGVFGGARHHELYPLVAFHCLPKSIDLIIEAAKATGVGLEKGGNGAVVAFASDIRNMMTFAQALRCHGRKFGCAVSGSAGRQLDLFDR
jgi:hypothetical protein